MLKIGDTIILEPLVSEKNEKYKCKLVERIDNRIFIDYPINMITGKTTFLLDGMQLKASFVGKDNNIYVFDTEILGRVKRGIPMLILHFKGNDSLVRIQRRQYVRIETAVDVAIEGENKEFPPFTTVTHDISAGGAAIILPDEIEVTPGLLINALFVLPMNSGQWGYEKVQCRVIRTIKDDRGKKTIVPLEFININENGRQLFTRFCFERQLHMKKKVW